MSVVDMVVTLVVLAFASLIVYAIFAVTRQMLKKRHRSRELDKDFEEAVDYIKGRKKKLTRFTTEKHRRTR